MTKLLAATAALAAAGAVALFGGVLREQSSARPATLPAARTADAFQPAYSNAQSAAALVLRLQQELRRAPDDSRSHALLGLAYQQRARETGDPSYYRTSGQVLRRALALDDANPLAFSGLAALALARHRFAEALRLGRRAHALSPQTAAVWGSIGDALVELGRYRDGFRAFDTLARLRPGLAAYARVSYARELLGDRSGAIAAMRLAADSATPGSEAAAWTSVQLGKLFFAGGEYPKARKAYRMALGHLPRYAYGLDALAQVEAAAGRTERAIALARRAVEAAPLPQYVALLGDLLQKAGRREAAARQFDLVGAIDRLFRANGVRTDLELALFRADHGIRLSDTVTRARDAYKLRPSIDAADVLAWSLARSGRCTEARGYSQRALRLGTQDALKLFHRGMIERCLGRGPSARRWLRRALDLNPGFSPRWAPVARRYAS